MAHFSSWMDFFSLGTTRTCITDGYDISKWPIFFGTLKIGHLGKIFLSAKMAHFWKGTKLAIFISLFASFYFFKDFHDSTNVVSRCLMSFLVIFGQKWQKKILKTQLSGSYQSKWDGLYLLSYTVACITYMMFSKYLKY